MFSRRSFVRYLAGVSLISASIALSPSAGSYALAADGPARAVAYTDDAFKSALASGKPILVQIHADWCTTCAAQKPILDRLLGGKFKDTVPFTVDFDAQKTVVRSFKAQMQSTLIVFRGGTEVGRSVGDTNAASIEALLSKGT